MSTSKRGFASISVEKRREIASKGGKSVPAEKRSFSQNRNLASEAGRKGGSTSHSAELGPDPTGELLPRGLAEWEHSCQPRQLS